MKYQLATPLLIANILKWMAPDIFRSREVQAGTVGLVSVPVAEGTDPASIRVVDREPAPAAFHDSKRHAAVLLRLSRRGQRAFRATASRSTRSRFPMSPKPSGVRPPASAAEFPKPPIWNRRLPTSGRGWRVLGGLGLLLDWLLYGRSRLYRLRAPAAVRKGGVHDLRSRLGPLHRLAAPRLGRLGVDPHAPAAGAVPQGRSPSWRSCWRWPSRASRSMRLASPSPSWWTPRPASRPPIWTAPPSWRAQCKPRRAAIG